MEYIATFFTHFGAIQFARQLEKKKITHDMMPVPRKLSSSCGTCVKFVGNLEDEFKQTIKDDEEIEGLYAKLDENYTTIFEKND